MDHIYWIMDHMYWIMEHVTNVTYYILLSFDVRTNARPPIRARCERPMGECEAHEVHQALCILLWVPISASDEAGEAIGEVWAAGVLRFKLLCAYCAAISILFLHQWWRVSPSSNGEAAAVTNVTEYILKSINLKLF